MKTPMTIGFPLLGEKFVFLVCGVGSKLVLRFGPQTLTSDLEQAEKKCAFINNLLRTTITYMIRYTIFKHAYKVESLYMSIFLCNDLKLYKNIKWFSKCLLNASSLFSNLNTVLDQVRPITKQLTKHKWKWHHSESTYNYMSIVAFYLVSVVNTFCLQSAIHNYSGWCNKANGKTI